MDGLDPPRRMPVANKGLARDSLPEMFQYPVGKRPPFLGLEPNDMD